MSNKEQAEDKPIETPPPVGAPYPFEPDWERPEGPSLKLGRQLADLVRKPVHWVRENIVEPNRGPKYYWYHRRYARAVPIDECYNDDLACMYEANQEFRRTYFVDRETLELLRYRRDTCYFWHVGDENRYFLSDKCKPLSETFRREELNFFIKYGDLPHNAHVVQAYMKQKHRLIMERRRAAREQQGDLPEKQPNSV